MTVLNIPRLVDTVVLWALQRTRLITCVSTKTNKATDNAGEKQATRRDNVDVVSDGSDAILLRGAIVETDNGKGEVILRPSNETGLSDTESGHSADRQPLQKTNKKINIVIYNYLLGTTNPSSYCQHGRPLQHRNCHEGLARS